MPAGRKSCTTSGATSSARCWLIFTIAIGIAAIGMINNTVRMLKRDLFGQFSDRNPASILIYASPFPDSLADSVSSMRGVELAEAQRTSDAFATDESGAWVEMNLLSVPDFNDVRINRTLLERGVAEPDLRGVLLERSAASALGLEPGDSLDGIFRPGEGLPADRERDRA